MNCTQFQNMLDDYLDGNLSPIQSDNLHSHLKGCELCKNKFSQAEEIIVSLRSIAVPPAREGYEQRMLNFLESKKSKKYQQRNWFMAGFGTAIAATLAMWLNFSLLSIPASNLEEVMNVNLSVDKTQKVDLIFNLPNELKDATLKIELPEKIEIAGYPGKRQLKWNTTFKKGANRLALPLIATEKQNGYLIASLIKNGKTKLFRIYLESKLPSSSKLIIDEAITNT